MTKRKAGPISNAEEARIQAAIARDPDAPEVTDEQAAQARPAALALDPALYANLTRRGRPKSEKSKQLVTLRLPPEVVEGYRASGPGWQVRMGEVLAAGLKGKLPRRAHITPVGGKVLAGLALKTSLTGRYSAVRGRAAAAGKPKAKPKSH